MQRGAFAACTILLTTLWMAGCGLRDEAPAPTATEPPPDFLEIVTPTPGTPFSGKPTTRPDRYVVRDGDSLLDIAVEFDVSVEALQEANDIEDPDTIVVGQELVIPPPP